MKNTKKILSVLLAVCMLASFLPMIALAATDEPYLDPAIYGEGTDWYEGDFIGDAVVEAEKLSDSPLRLSVTVTLNGKVLTEGKDYTVSTYEDTAAGTVTVMAVGEHPYYYGIAMRTFNIDELESDNLIRFFLLRFLLIFRDIIESFFKIF